MEEKELKEIEQLLGKIENIAKQSEELSALKGENFNVFQIFRMESDENKMHSRFINTLLDPKGPHGRGAVFLKLFLNTLDIPFLNTLNDPPYFKNIDAVKTKVEHYIGEVKIQGQESEGGRIDIYISDNEKSISIENKIYAVDQEKQIVRYCNYNKKPNTVFYLNLEGTEPDGDFSKGTYKSDKDENIENPEKPDFYCISYSKTILEWLEKCQKEASDFPIIRESIKQYIITIKRLTNQLTNQKMEEAVNELIIKNYKSAEKIASNYESAISSKIDNFLIALQIALQSSLKKEPGWTIEKKDVREKFSNLKIFHNDWIAETAIILKAEPYFWKNHSYLGLQALEKSNFTAREKLKKADFKSENGYDYHEESKVWVFRKLIFNFGNDEQFKKLLTDESKDDNFTKLLTNDSKDDFLLKISDKIIQLAKQLKSILKST